MSRSGYTDDWDYDNWRHIIYRGAVTSAMRGKRGQALFRDLLAALDAMPKKRLIAHELEENGAVCALGAVGRSRGIDMTNLDPEDYNTVAGTFDIATSLAREIVFENDECGAGGETPEQRWVRIRKWVVGQIKQESKNDSGN